MSNNLIELLELVVDRDSFITFVRPLAAEREEAQELERLRPQYYSLGGALNWQHADIASYLFACLDYFEEKPFHHPESAPGWRMFAEFPWTGKIVE